MEVRGLPQEGRVCMNDKLLNENKICKGIYRDIRLEPDSQSLSVKLTNLGFFQKFWGHYKVISESSILRQLYGYHLLG
jgi:hypothetical protein